MFHNFSLFFVLFDGFINNKEKEARGEKIGLSRSFRGVIRQLFSDAMWVSRYLTRVAWLTKIVIHDKLDVCPRPHDTTYKVDPRDSCNSCNFLFALRE